MYDWPRRNISPKSIILDLRNPRLVRPGSTKSQKTITEAMFESSKTRDLAKNISDNGYFPDEALIVTPTDSGRKYIVLEGNRRVAACQALLKPETLKGTRHYQYVQRLSKRADGIKSTFKKIFCVIAPSREAARKVIANKHTKTLREKWSVYAQGNYYYQDMQDGLSFSEISDINGVSVAAIRSHIHMCILAEVILSLSWDEETLLWLKENIDDLGVTAISRALNSTFFKAEIAKFNFEENGNITSDLTVEEASKFLMSLVNHAHFVSDDQKLTTRTTNDEATTKKYFSETFTGYRPDRSQDGERFDAFTLLGGQANPPPDADQPHTDEASPPPPTPSPRPTPSKKKNHGVFLRGISPFLRNEKIDALLEESLRTSPKNKYATVFLIRSLLEVVLATRVKEKGLWSDYLTNYCGGHENRSGLDSLLRYALAASDVIPDTGDKRTIEAGLTTVNAVFRKLMNLAMHNDTFLLTDTEVGDVRTKVTPVLAHLIEQE